VRGARYDEIADFYDGFVRDRLDDNAGTAAIMKLVGDVQGRRVLDLACGQRIARELARRGASVVGIDVSAALLAKARAAEEADPLGIGYALADASSSDALHGDSFDLVICNFGLSDIDGLAGALATVVRLLPGDGTFVFSILHPCFPGWGEGAAPSSWPPFESYFREGWWQAQNPGFRGKVGANHRMLSTYLNSLVQHGLAIEYLVEPTPAEWPEPSPTVPVYLVVRCCKRD
jgi:ubiquinone/menaquinone biosynthesis C-methylase UbiE